MFTKMWNMFIAMMTRAKLARQAKRDNKPITKSQAWDIRLSTLVHIAIVAVIAVVAVYAVIKAVTFMASLGLGPFAFYILTYLLAGMIGRLTFFGWLMLMIELDLAIIREFEIMERVYEREFDAETVTEVIHVTRWEVQFNNDWIHGKTGAENKYRYNDQYNGQYA